MRTDGSTMEMNPHFVEDVLKSGLSKDAKLVVGRLSCCQQSSHGIFRLSCRPPCSVRGWRPL